MISTSALIAKFQTALDEQWGYIYGKTHELWSAEKQAQYVKDYGHDSDRAQSCKYGEKWAGHWVTDCSGLFKWAFESLGGEMYHGSNTMFKKWCTATGKLTNGKRTDGKELKPGTAVFTGNESTHNHVGLYVGNGWVIEAQGSKNGVIRSKITNSKWTYWGELKGVDYGAKSGDSAAPDQKNDNPVADAQTAIVTAQSGRTVKMRAKPSASCKLYWDVPVGSEVIVDESGEPWSRITWNGREGYMMTQFLQAEDSGALYAVVIPHLTAAEADQIMALYKGAYKEKEVG